MKSCHLCEWSSRIIGDKLGFLANKLNFGYMLPRIKQPGCLVPVSYFDVDNIDTYIHTIQIQRKYYGIIVYVDDGFAPRDRCVNLSISLTSETGLQMSHNSDNVELGSKSQMSIVFRDSKMDSELGSAVADGLKDLLLHHFVEIIVDYAQPHSPRSMLKCVEQDIFDQINYRSTHWAYQSQMGPYPSMQNGQKSKNQLYFLKIHYNPANQLDAFLNGQSVDKLEQLLNLPGQYKLLLYLSKAIHIEDHTCYCELHLRKVIVNTAGSLKQKQNLAVQY